MNFMSNYLSSTLILAKNVHSPLFSLFSHGREHFLVECLFGISGEVNEQFFFISFFFLSFILYSKLPETKLSQKEAKKEINSICLICSLVSFHLIFF